MILRKFENGEIKTLGVMNFLIRAHNRFPLQGLISLSIFVKIRLVSWIKSILSYSAVISKLKYNFVSNLIFQID